MGNYVVVGGSSGIGKALVGILEQEGHRVFATYHKNPLADRLRVHYQALDVLVDDLDTSGFPDALDGLVYCPGSINLKPFRRFSEADFLADFKLQVLGATKIIRCLLPQLKNGHGAIVMFSTVAVQKGFNFHSQVSTSKGAVEGLTRALAAEFAPKVRVNAIAPSLTDTPLAGQLLSTAEKKAHHAKGNPLGKVGRAEDIAAAAAFLLSPQAAWVTGQIIHVDGGHSSLGK